MAAQPFFGKLTGMPVQTYCPFSMPEENRPSLPKGGGTEMKMCAVLYEAVRKEPEGNKGGSYVIQDFGKSTHFKV